jgi:dTDP-4-amino-4,6-dideoxygalactose transaminase
MSYKIPLFDLNFDEEEELAVIETLRSKWISMGPSVSSLEALFAKHLNVKHAIAVTNCTAALHLALKILQIGEGDEVIAPSFTFVATVNAVRYVNAIPVFADITGYEDFSIDPADIEMKITSRTKAIIVMHYGGFACNMDRIMQLAARYNLYVIEDTAHAPDSEFNHKKLGTIGDIGCFSFFSNKNITCGEGGMLVTNNPTFAQKANLLRAHGMTTLSYERAKGHATGYDVIELGYNYRMDDIRAAIALVQLNKLQSDTVKRSELRQEYMKQLGNSDKIIIPYQKILHKSSNYIFPVLLKDSTKFKRDEIRKNLAKVGIETSVHYPAVHNFLIYKNFKLSPLIKTEYVSENEITLPLYYNLKIEDIKFISELLLHFISK